MLTLGSNPRSISPSGRRINVYGPHLKGSVTRPSLPLYLYGSEFTVPKSNENVSQSIKRTNLQKDKRNPRILLKVYEIYKKVFY